MADSIFELASEAASSTLFIFFIFNLIILIVLFTSKPLFSSSDNQNDDDMPVSIVIHSNTNTEKKFLFQKNDTVDVCEVTETLNEPDRYNNFNCFDTVEESSDNCEDEDEDDEDFRRRVEEFIEKVNSGWREEKAKNLEIGRVDATLVLVSRTN